MADAATLRPTAWNSDRFAKGHFQRHRLLIRIQTVPGWAWMLLILKVSLLWLSSGSSRSWTLQALTEPCAWSPGRLHLLKGLGLLVDAHALAVPSSRLGADVFFRRRRSSDSSVTRCLKSTLSRLRALISWRVASRVASRLKRCLPDSMNSLVQE